MGKKRDRIVSLLDAFPVFQSMDGVKFKFIYERALKDNDDISRNFVKRVAKDLGYQCSERVGGLELAEIVTCGVCLMRQGETK